MVIRVSSSFSYISVKINVDEQGPEGSVFNDVEYISSFCRQQGHRVIKNIVEVELESVTEGIKATCSRSGHEWSLANNGRGRKI